MAGNTMRYLKLSVFLLVLGIFAAYFLLNAADFRPLLDIKGYFLLLIALKPSPPPTGAKKLPAEEISDTKNFQKLKYLY